MGERLGRFTILKHLATGGMADVLLARADGIEGFERHIVVKRIRAEFASDQRFIAMFLDEARVAAGLHHQNIVQVHDIGEANGEYFFTMEYLHGEDLRRMLSVVSRTRQHMPLSVVIAIITAAAAGLHYAHDRTGSRGEPLDIVHRDVSPSNILVGYDGSVKVVDFGIAKAASRQTETKSGSLKGKVSYMSPEQCRGEPVDRRSDVYALGIVLYELVSTTRLFKNESEYLIMDAIVTGKIPPIETRRSDVSPDLAGIINQALATDPEQRFQSADALRVALDQFASRRGLTASGSAIASYMQQIFGSRLEPWLDLGPETRIEHDRPDRPVHASWTEIPRTPGDPNDAKPISERRAFPLQAPVTPAMPMMIAPSAAESSRSGSSSGGSRPGSSSGVSRPNALPVHAARTSGASPIIPISPISSSTPPTGSNISRSGLARPPKSVTINPRDTRTSAHFGFENTPAAQVSLPPPPAGRSNARLALIVIPVFALGGFAVWRLTAKSESATPEPDHVVAAVTTEPVPPSTTSKEKAMVDIELEADAPGARVVFRRHVTPAPLKQSIAASTVVELVEISATGYKSERYWLTFDRATHLRAHLVKGSGSEEATEGQTLIALGEAAADAVPTPPVVVAAKPDANHANPANPASVPANPAAKNPGVATAGSNTPATAPIIPRRKIGHAAADENGSGAAPVETPVAVPIDAGAASVVVAVEPPRPVTPPPIVPAKPEPPRTVAPTALRALLISSSEITLPDTVSAQMVRDSKKVATITLKLCIDVSGAVSSVGVIKASGYSGFDAQVVAGVRSWRYRPYVADGHPVPACSATSVSVSPH